MSYVLRLSLRAEQDIDALYAYFSDYSAERASQLARICFGAISDVGRTPYRWPYFRLTGAPYRARLIRSGQMTVWLIYLINEPDRSIDILRLWESRQDPSRLRE
jgi:plasmid stabilization system protein ParE